MNTKIIIFGILLTLSYLVNIKAQTGNINQDSVAFNRQMIEEGARVNTQTTEASKKCKKEQFCKFTYNKKNPNS